VNSVCAQLVSSSGRAEVENFLLIVTPSALMNLMRAKPGTAGGGIDTATLLFGRTKTISADVSQLSLRLLLSAQLSMLAFSAGHDSALDTGTMR